MPAVCLSAAGSVELRSGYFFGGRLALARSARSSAASPATATTFGRSVEHVDSRGAGSRSQDASEAHAASRDLSAPILIPKEPMPAFLNLRLGRQGLSGAR